MTLRSRIARAYWRGIFRLAERHEFSGCRVGVFFASATDCVVLEQKCADALRLIEVYSPKHSKRLGECVYGILLLGKVRFLGRWLQPARIIQLNHVWMLESDTRSEDVAATIVHEATHAWLDRRGLSYAVECRQRIEAICFRAQAAFSLHIPGYEDMAVLYEACATTILDRPADDWSDEAFRKQRVEELRELGAPAWLVRALTMLPNER